MARDGKQNSRSYLREEIRAVEDIKALLIELNQQRIKVKRAAWHAGDQEIYAIAEKQKQTLLKLKRIFSRYYMDLQVQLEEE